MSEPRTYSCPLCTNSFGGDGEGCHSSCPMAKGCRMIKCPRCNYEFVEDSAIVNFFRRLVHRDEKVVERR